MEQIANRQSLLSAGGYQWDVVESLPVSEAIKTQSEQMTDHIANYKSSLQALAAADVKTVCYNFMPILDWTRTSLRALQPHGGAAMLFNLVDFAVFDLHILKRIAVSDDYSMEVRNAALIFDSKWPISRHNPSQFGQATHPANQRVSRCAMTAQIPK